MELPNDVYFYLRQFLGPKELLLSCLTCSFLKKIFNTPLAKQYGKCRGDVFLAARSGYYEFVFWNCENNLRDDGQICYTCIPSHGSRPENLKTNFWNLLPPSLNSNNVQLVKYLCSKLEPGYKRCSSVIDRVCREGKLEMAKVLCEYGWETNDVIDRYSCSLEPEMIKWRVIERKNSLQNGLMIRFACQEGKVEIVKLLVELGAVPSESDLFNACELGRFEVAKFLVEKCRVDPFFQQGVVFLASCWSRNEQLSEWLIENYGFDRKIKEGIV